MSDILSAALAAAPADELAGLPLPDFYRAPLVRRSETGHVRRHGVRRQGPPQVPARRRGPAARARARRGLRGCHGHLHQLQHRLDLDLRAGVHLRLPDRSKDGPWAARHDLAYHVVGSDPAGVVLRTGPAVRNWKPGDQVVAHCNYVDDQDPSAHDDSMLAANQRIWGFETNFGGLADLALVKANQLMPKPAHLSWEEAAINALCNSTAYRMLVSPNGARMKQGDKVLIWGASGGLGSYAVQHVLNGGGTPIGVVSSPEKVALLNDLGVEAVIDRRAADYKFWTDEHTQDDPSGAASARTSAAWSAASPTSSSNTRAARPWAPRSSPASGPAPS